MANTEEQLAMIWNAMSPAVEQRIRATGSFSTLGATLRPGHPVEAFVAAAAQNGSELLRAHLRTLAATGEYEAIGIASQVEANVPESTTPVSGILYQFDNVSGSSQATFLPYTVDAAGNITYGELHGQEGDHAMFGSPR